MSNHTFDIESRLDPDLAKVRACFPSLGFNLRDLAGSRAILEKLGEQARIHGTSGIAVEEFAVARPKESTKIKLRSSRPLRGSAEKPA